MAQSHADAPHRTSGRQPDVPLPSDMHSDPSACAAVGLALGPTRLHQIHDAVMEASPQSAPGPGWPSPAMIGAATTHETSETERLVYQTSVAQFTLSAAPANAACSPQASSAAVPRGLVPDASGNYEQPCLICPDAAAIATTSASSGPPASQVVATQSCLSIGPYPQIATDCRLLASDAQSAPPISHEHARKETRMRDARLAADEDSGRHSMHLPVARSRSSVPFVPGCVYEYSAATADAAVRRVDTHTSQSQSLADLPNELLVYILGFLDVSDLLVASRISHQFRSLALAPIVHRLRLRHARAALPPLLLSPSRPSLADLIARSIFLTNTTVVSRRLARSLTAIRLSRRLAVRPPPEALVARSVLPAECLPGQARGVAPALVAKTRAVERERVKDDLRRWVGNVWERRWREKAEDRRRWEERCGVGRVWKLRRFWERVGRGEVGVL